MDCQVEPTEVFRDLLFLFRESSADASDARRQAHKKMEDDMKRQQVCARSRGEATLMNPL